jgi:hypothetical protein
MRSLRRLLLTALLTVLVLGCAKKAEPVGVEESIQDPLARKIKGQPDDAEGPQLRP